MNKANLDCIAHIFPTSVILTDILLSLGSRKTASIFDCGIILWKLISLILFLRLLVQTSIRKMKNFL